MNDHRHSVQRKPGVDLDRAAGAPGRQTLASRLPAGPPVVQRTPESALRRFEDLVAANPHPTRDQLSRLLEPMRDDERRAVLAEIERRFGDALAEQVRTAIARRVAPFETAPAALDHADDDPARLADLDLPAVCAVYAMQGRWTGARATGMHRAPNGAVFSYEWVHSDAGTAILRGELRSRMVSGVTADQAVSYRAAIAALRGPADRIAELRAMVDEAERRTGEHHTETAPTLLDEGTQGRTYASRGASRVDGADMSDRIHAAMDVTSSRGTGVYAPVAGVVVPGPAMVRGYGNLVTLVHDTMPEPYAGRRFQTAYAHLSQRLVESGPVSAGQAIGLVGNTRTDADGDGGRVAGGMAPHLHFGVIELFGGAAAGAWGSRREETYGARRDHIRPDDWLAALSVRISEAPHTSDDSGGSEPPARATPAARRARAHTAPAAEGAATSDGPVQRRAEPDAPAGSTDVVATAQAGVAGGGGALPHLDLIQARFGAHDVSGIRAHVGGGAGEAARAIGARAYATGDAVAFRDAPDLHEAAHEAAHVVQQRAGVDVAGGVGASGDRYEQHADAVADAVVRGESVEALLDPFAAPARGGAGALQRTPAEALRRFEALLAREPHPSAEQLAHLLEPMPAADRDAVLPELDRRLGHTLGEQVRARLAEARTPSSLMPGLVTIPAEITHADDDVERLAGDDLRAILALYAMRGHAIGDRATGFHRTPSGATFSYAWVTSPAGTAALRNVIRGRLRALPAAELPGLSADVDRLDGPAARIDELRALIAATTAPAAAGEDVAARLPPGVTEDQVEAAVAFDTGLHLRIDWVRRMQARLRADGRMTSVDGTFDAATVTGVMWLQHDAGLTVDGRITGDTRRTIEAGFTELHDGLLGEHLAARVLVPGTAPTEARYGYYRDLITGAGGVFLDGPGEINLLGIRGVEVDGTDGHLEIRQTDSAAAFAAARAEAGDPVPGASVPEGTHADRRHFSGRTARDHGFDDVIVSVRYTQNEAGERVYHVSEHRGSVDPQSHWGDAHDEGSAHLRDGTYRYRLGTHTTHYDRHREAVAGFASDPTMRHSTGASAEGPTTTYAALQPVDGLEIWRDDDAHDDHFLTSAEVAESERHIDDLRAPDAHHDEAYRDPRYTSGASIGINIHSAPRSAPSSQGCQNVPVDEHYTDLIHEIADSPNRGNVYYTLLDASRIPGALVVETSTALASPDASSEAPADGATDTAP